MKLCYVEQNPKALLLSTLKFSLLQSLEALASLKESSLWVGIQWFKVFPSSDTTISTYGPSVTVAEEEKAQASSGMFMVSLSLTFHHSILSQDLTLTLRKLKGNNGNAWHCSCFLFPHFWIHFVFWGESFKTFSFRLYYCSYI